MALCEFSIEDVVRNVSSKHTTGNPYDRAEYIETLHPTKQKYGYQTDNCSVNSVDFGASFNKYIVDRNER